VATRLDRAEIGEEIDGPAQPSERVALARYAPHGDSLLYAMDSGGNERMQLFLLSEEGTRTTALTNAHTAIHEFGGWSHDGQQIAFASNARDAAFFDIYTQSVPSGVAKRVYTQDGNNYTVNWSPNNRSLLIARHLSNMHNQLFLLDLESGEVRALTDPTQPALYSSVNWAADGESLLLLSDLGRDTMALARLDLATLALHWLHTGAWDCEQLRLSTDGRHLALVENVDGYSVLSAFDAATLQPLTLPTLPSGVILDIEWSPDGATLAITLANATHNADIWLLAPVEGVARQLTFSARAGIPQASLVAPDLIRYPTFDGREIPAFYYLPTGIERDLPVVVYVHGGPESQFVPSFNPVVQYLVHRGYAVFAPNVRGSTGYGNAYTHLDDVRLRMDSVADLAHAVAWLRGEGHAHPQRIAVMGGSYGGFMTLSAITTYPDLWAAAVCIVGIANFVTFLENTGPWRRKLREAEYGSLDQDRTFLEEISPIHHIDRIAAPLFVIHGANDPRVPVDEAEQIVQGLRQRSHPVEYLRFEDEGHGLVKLPNRIHAYSEVAAFLDRHLQR